MKTYMCRVCGWVYDENLAYLKMEIVPGTRWEDFPEDWRCPDCGESRDAFEMLEI